MNLIEALKSGKPFQRIAGSALYDCSQVCYQFTKLEVLAGDWMLIEEPVAVTPSKFEAAWRKAVSGTSDTTTICNTLKQELGIR